MSNIYILKCFLLSYKLSNIEKSKKNTNKLVPAARSFRLGHTERNLL